MKARAAAAAALLAIAAACGWVIAHTAFVSDLSAFMPRAPDARQQLLLEQFRDGVVARLVLAGIEGGTPAQRAQASLALGTALRRDRDHFVGVQNGDAGATDADARYFFAARYLLAPDDDPRRFTAAGLHAALLDSLDSLAGEAGPLLSRSFARDPTGAAARLVERFAGNSAPRVVEGAWASPDGQRALLLAQTRAAGSDLDAQAQAVQRIRAAFDALQGRAADLRLQMTGTAVLSLAARSTVEGEVARLALASFLFVSALLVAVYRSLTLFALGMVPVVLGALAGIAAVALGFGSVHSLTLGFGSTLIGEAVDYSIYYFLQSRGRPVLPGFWRTLALGVLTSVAGYSMLLLSGFTSLAQLGLYSIAGLVVAALAARYALPALLPRSIRVRELRAPALLLDRLLGRAASLRWLPLAALAAAALAMAMHAGQVWNRRLIDLSPVSAHDQLVDAELRRGWQVADLRYLLAFSAPDEQAALEKAERAGAVLDALQARDLIGAYASPAFALPSLARQRERQAAIPPPERLRANLAEALAGLPLQAARFDGFLADAQAARVRAPLAHADLEGSSAAMLVDSLLVPRGRDVLVMLPMHAAGGDGEIDVGQVRAALAAAGLDDVATLDILAETTALFESYLREALGLVAAGAGAITLLLWLSLRSWRRTLRILAPLACAVLCDAGALLAAGTSLTIFHLVGLLLVVGIGSNYALFFESARSPGAGERSRTRLSLVVANIATVGGFGVLGFSSVGVLSSIGLTVALGALLCLVFSAILIGRGSIDDASARGGSAAAATDPV
jgi:predicted exporter